MYPRGVSVDQLYGKIIQFFLAREKKRIRKRNASKVERRVMSNSWYYETARGSSRPVAPQFPI